MSSHFYTIYSSVWSPPSFPLVSHGVNFRLKQSERIGEHQSKLSLCRKRRGSLWDVLCALHFLSSLFCHLHHFSTFAFDLPRSLSSFCLHQQLVSWLFCSLSEAARVSCTWSSPSVKTASSCWDRTARPLTPSRIWSIFTPHTSSPSGGPSTCPCCSLCWCRLSDLTSPGPPAGFKELQTWMLDWTIPDPLSGL